MITQWVIDLRVTSESGAVKNGWVNFVVRLKKPVKKSRAVYRLAYSPERERFAGGVHWEDFCKRFEEQPDERNAILEDIKEIAERVAPRG